MREMTEQEALEIIRQWDYCEIHLTPMVEDKHRHPEYVGPKYCEKCRYEQDAVDRRELDKALYVLGKRSPR